MWGEVVVDLFGPDGQDPVVEDCFKLFLAALEILPQNLKLLVLQIVTAIEGDDDIENLENARDIVAGDDGISEALDQAHADVFGDIEINPFVADVDLVQNVEAYFELVRITQTVVGPLNQLFAYWWLYDYCAVFGDKMREEILVLGLQEDVVGQAKGFFQHLINAIMDDTLSLPEISSFEIIVDNSQHKLKVESDVLAIFFINNHISIGGSLCVPDNILVLDKVGHFDPELIELTHDEGVFGDWGGPDVAQLLYTYDLEFIENCHKFCWFFIDFNVFVLHEELLQNLKGMQHLVHGLDWEETTLLLYQVLGHFFQFRDPLYLFLKFIAA